MTARPHRWVALQQDKRAWGLFWAGGGLQRCRELLAERVNDAEACSALVPVSAERVLDLVLSQEEAKPQTRTPGPWRLVLLTSAVWLALLAAVVSGFVVLLERQNRTLQLLLERTEPALERSTEKAQSHDQD